MCLQGMKVESLTKERDHRGVNFEFWIPRRNVPGSTRISSFVQSPLLSRGSKVGRVQYNVRIIYSTIPVGP